MRSSCCREWRLMVVVGYCQLYHSGIGGDNLEKFKLTSFSEDWRFYLTVPGRRRASPGQGSLGGILFPVGWSVLSRFYSFFSLLVYLFWKSCFRLPGISNLASLLYYSFTVPPPPPFHLPAPPASSYQPLTSVDRLPPSYYEPTFDTDAKLSGVIYDAETKVSGKWNCMSRRGKRG